MKKLDFTPKKVLYLAFAAIESVIYIIFNVLTATTPGDTIYLKYAGVLLCLAVSGVMIYFNERSKDSIILFCALICTAISDLFILVLNTYYPIGLVTFIFTQTVHFYRMYCDRMDKIKVSLIIRIALTAVLWAVMDVVSKDGLNFMIAEVCLYIVMLAGNVIDAFLLCRRSYRNLIFAIGLLLFLCCDICVGLDNAGMVGLDIPYDTRKIINFFIWVFYLPSQVLIVLSGGVETICGKSLFGRKNIAVTADGGEPDTVSEKTEESGNEVK